MSGGHHGTAPDSRYSYLPDSRRLPSLKDLSFFNKRLLPPLGQENPAEPTHTPSVSSVSPENASQPQGHSIRQPEQWRRAPSQSGIAPGAMHHHHQEPQQQHTPPLSAGHDRTVHGMSEYQSRHDNNGYLTPGVPLSAQMGSAAINGNSNVRPGEDLSHLHPHKRTRTATLSSAELPRDTRAPPPPSSYPAPSHYGPSPYMSPAHHSQPPSSPYHAMAAPPPHSAPSPMHPGYIYQQHPYIAHPRTVSVADAPPPTHHVNYAPSVQQPPPSPQGHWEHATPHAPLAPTHQPAPPHHSPVLHQAPHHQVQHPSVHQGHSQQQPTTHSSSSLAHHSTAHHSPIPHSAPPAHHASIPPHPSLAHHPSTAQHFPSTAHHQAPSHHPPSSHHPHSHHASVNAHLHHASSHQPTTPHSASQTHFSPAPRHTSSSLHPPPTVHQTVAQHATHHSPSASHPSAAPHHVSQAPYHHQPAPGPHIAAPVPSPAAPLAVPPSSLHHSVPAHQTQHIAHPSPHVAPHQPQPQHHHQGQPPQVVNTVQHPSQSPYPRTTAIVPTELDTRTSYPAPHPQAPHVGTPDALVGQIIELCNILYSFAHHWAQAPSQVQPSPSEVADMMHRANQVVRLLEDLKRHVYPDSERPKSSSTLARDDHRPPKRPWEDMSQENGEDEANHSSFPDTQPYKSPGPIDVKPMSNQQPGPSRPSQSQAPEVAQPSSGPSAAEQDMELIRNKRASSNSAATNGTQGHVKNKYRKRSRASPPGKCHSCNIRETPEWRRGPDGARTLCNACGLHYAKLMRKQERHHGTDAATIDMETLRASARAADHEKARAASNKQQKRKDAAVLSSPEQKPTLAMPIQSHHQGSFQVIPPPQQPQAPLQPPPAPPLQPPTPQMQNVPPPPPTPSSSQPHPTTSGPVPPPPWSNSRSYAPEQLQSSQSFMRSATHHPGHQSASSR